MTFVRLLGMSWWKIIDDSKPCMGHSRVFMRKICRMKSDRIESLHLIVHPYLDDSLLLWYTNDVVFSQEEDFLWGSKAEKRNP